MYIILAILGFSLLIIGHELGHFTMAKLNNVKVEEFSLGMGPKIFSIKGKETEYLIKALPIGGYVKMLGEEEKTDDPRSFSSKSSFRKLTIIAAGPLMNFIMAVVFFIIISFGSGVVLPKVNEVVPDSPAEKSDIQKGDMIIKVNNKKVDMWQDFSMEIATNGKNPVKILIQRDSKLLEKEITPMEIQENGVKRLIVGVSPYFIKNPTIFQALNNGVRETKYFIKATYVGFKQLFTGKASLNDVGGPITIIRATGEAAKNGAWTLLSFIAFLSIQLAIFNIIPFPALDGGWIFLLLFEIISRRKIDDNKVAIVNYIGFTCLMIIMVLVIVKDIFFPVKF